MMVCTCNGTGACYVCKCAEIDRLRKIESAARVYFREFDHLIGDEYPERADLRQALGLAQVSDSEGGA